MELDVEPHEPVAVALGTQLVEMSSELLELLVGDPGRRYGRGRRFQDAPDLEYLQSGLLVGDFAEQTEAAQQGGAVEIGDVGAVSDPHVQDPEMRQHSHCFAQRSSRHAHERREFSFGGQPARRCQLAGADHRHDPADGAVGC